MATISSRASSYVDNILLCLVRPSQTRVLRSPITRQLASCYLSREARLLFFLPYDEPAANCYPTDRGLMVTRYRGGVVEMLSAVLMVLRCGSLGITQHTALLRR
jgi:hypothetical protein